MEERKKIPQVEDYRKRRAEDFKRLPEVKKEDQFKLMDQ
jgi:hypothetical protein